MYLVHSYYAEENENTIATTDYELSLCTQHSKKIIFMAFSFTQKKVGNLVRKNLTKLFKSYSMRIIPAIDIIEGKCVRLTKGDYSTKNNIQREPIGGSNRHLKMPESSICMW